MEGKDWAVILGTLLAPLVAGFIVFGLNRLENHRRSVRDLFYGLNRHVDQFQIAMYALLSHSINWEQRGQWVAGPPELTQMVERVEQQGIETTLNGRLALSALNADKLMIRMLFGPLKPKPLLEQLDCFTSLMNTFLPTQKGGSTPEYREVRDLPIDAAAVDVRNEIEKLWETTNTPLDEF